MAYPTVPGRRMAWDADGSIGFQVRTDGNWAGPIQAPAELTINQKTELNDEDVVSVALSSLDAQHGWLGIIFPELREIDGVSVGLNPVQGSGNHYVALQDSGDTTNGVDGSWGTAVADIHGSTHPITTDGYRTIVSTARSNKRGLRLQRDFVSGQSGAVTAWVHVYGEIASGETADRLLWVDNSTGTEFSLPIDYGDVPRGSASDTEVKLRNNSSTLSASSVQITAESLYLTSGSWYEFKEAGSFQATLPLASSIGTSADSPVITIRRIIPDDETLGVHAARAYVSVGSWA